MPRAKASAWNSNLRLRTVRQKDRTYKSEEEEKYLNISKQQGLIIQTFMISHIPRCKEKR